MRRESDVNGQDHQAVRIWEADDALLTSMQQKLDQKPQLLTSTAGGASCCIFRVPQSLVETNNKAYKPHILSIGPYHHGKEDLRMIEEHKWRLLGSLLARTQTNGLRLNDYVKAMMPLEEPARECYSEEISLDSNQFVQMLVLDGCFIVELLRKVEGLVAVDKDDPIFTMPWVIPFLMRDLLSLENQLPFFVLEHVFNWSKLAGDDEESLAMLAIKFFNRAMERPEEVIERCCNLKGKHLLDLFRSSFIVSAPEVPKKENPLAQLIPCVTKLRMAGIKFKPGKTDSFLEIKFRNGVLEIPSITIDDFSSSVFLNCMAFEQCHRHCSKHFTTYATFMDCLINTSRDVGFLCDDKIIENYYGTDEEVAQFFNGLGKDVAFDVENCYLSSEFEKVNAYYKNNWHVHLASFKNTYFSSPWSFTSALAAIILLILTLVQSFFAALAYFRPPPSIHA